MHSNKVGEQKLTKENDDWKNRNESLFYSWMKARSNTKPEWVQKKSKDRCLGSSKNWERRNKN